MKNKELIEIIDSIDEELSQICIKAKEYKEKIFERDNIDNESMNLKFSDRYEKALGYELGIREAIKVFEKIFDKLEEKVENGN